MCNFLSINNLIEINTYLKGTPRTPWDQMALLSLVSILTSWVPICFSANFLISCRNKWVQYHTLHIMQNIHLNSRSQKKSHILGLANILFSIQNFNQENPSMRARTGGFKTHIFFNFSRSGDQKNPQPLHCRILEGGSYIFRKNL